MPKFKKSLSETKLNLPIVNESTLIVPEFFAVKRTSKTGKESYRLVNPLTKSRNLSKRNGETTIKLIRRPVEHMIIMSHKTEPIPLTMFSKKDRNTITEHFKVVETHKGKPIQDIPDSAPFANKKRGPQARTKRKYTKYATQEERDEARKKADRDRKFKKRQQIKGGMIGEEDSGEILIQIIDELTRLYKQELKQYELSTVSKLTTDEDNDVWERRNSSIKDRIADLEQQYIQIINAINPSMTFTRRDMDAIKANALKTQYNQDIKDKKQSNISPDDVKELLRNVNIYDNDDNIIGIREYDEPIGENYAEYHFTDSDTDEDEDTSNQAGGSSGKGKGFKKRLILTYKTENSDSDSENGNGVNSKKGGGLAGHIVRHLYRGGALSAKHIKEFASASYQKESPLNIDDFVLDQDLTNDFAKTYYNNKTKQAVVVHRGTNPTIGDWLNNAHYVMGTYKLTRRYWTGKQIQDGAEKKYGAKNVSTLGHSQGAKLARDLGGKSKEIITINPAYLGEKQKSNEYRIRSSADPVSGLLAPVNKLKEGVSWLFGGKKKENFDKQNITIKADTFNPLTEHSFEILDRIHPDTIIGVPETPQDIEGSGLNDKNHLVQSVVFHKDKFTISTAKKWLKENGYKCSKVDEEPNTIRFRQISPITIKNQGYTEYHNKTLGNSGIILVIAYKHSSGSSINIHHHIIHIHH